MLNRVDLSNALGVSRSADELDAEPLEAALAEDGESLRHVAAGAGGIEHTTDDRTTTIEPSDGNYAYAAATDRRVHFLLGGDPESPELTFPLEAVTAADVRDGLLSSTLRVRTGDHNVRLTPADTERAEALADFVSRIGASWADLDTALTAARGAVHDARQAIEAGQDPTDAIQRARTRLSKAHHLATHEDEAPTDLMAAEIEPVESELEDLRVATRTDRVADLLDDAREAREAGEYGTAFAAVAEAAGVIATARDALGDLDDADGDLATAVEERAADLTDVRDDLLGDAEDPCHRALDADDAAEAVDAWDDALDRYRAALSADWPEDGRVDPEALRFQLAWVVGNLIDALVDAADALEREGDDLGEDHDDSLERYESARERLERARTLAAEHPHAAAAPLDDSLERVDEKRERAQWQWGSSD